MQVKVRRFQRGVERRRNKGIPIRAPEVASEDGEEVEVDGLEELTLEQQ